jgi:hypothetical protein
MDRVTFQTALGTAADEAAFLHLEAAAREMDPAELVAALLPVAVKSQVDGPAYFAARLLYELNPPCRISPDEAVRALVPGWDVSIEEVPWYLARQFGKPALEAAVRRLEAEATDHDTLLLMGAVRYWAGMEPSGW